MPTQYLANLEDPRRLEDLRRLEVVLASGQPDLFLGSTQQLAGLLAAKAIPHQLHVWNDRAHSPKHWAKMIPLYL
jgi:esterase/lipase superfamily enzyme